MLWAMTAVTFLATFAVIAAVVYALTPHEQGVASRLQRLFQPAKPVHETPFVEKQKERVRDTLATIGKALPASSAKPSQGSKAQLLLTRAGYRSANAMLAMRGFKLLLPAVALAFVWGFGLYRQSFIYPLLAVVLGFLLPDLWLSSRVHSRQRKLRRGLPDALDLMVICVEAGLGLDQAMLRVAQELRIAHHELSEELQLVNLEMRVGKTRIEALRELARRTGLEDIKALTAMLIQTERFGTSVAQSLRVHSDDLRVKRRQRAEEMSAKTAVKMVPALVFFIFPALMVVILGPAFLTIMRDFPH